MYNDEEKFWRARSQVLRDLAGSDEGERAAEDMMPTTASPPRRGTGGGFGARASARERGTSGFLDEEFLVDSLLDASDIRSNARESSEETRRQKLAAHKWLVSLASFRDDLSLMVETIRNQKGLLAEQKLREQGNQVELLDEVLRFGKDALTDRRAELARIGKDVKAFMERLAAVIYGTHRPDEAAWVEDFENSFQGVCDLRERLSSEYLPARGQSQIAREDFYFFLERWETRSKVVDKMSNGRRNLASLLRSNPRGTHPGEGGSARAAQERGIPTLFSNETHQIAGEMEEAVRWMESRHAQELGDMRTKISAALGIDLGAPTGSHGLETASGRGQNPSPAFSVHEEASAFFGAVGQTVGHQDETTTSQFFHTAYRSVLQAIQKAHQKEKAVLHATIKTMADKMRAITGRVETQSAQAAQAQKKIAILEEEAAVVELKREKEKLQMIDAMKKMDLIREKEREISDAKEREREEERALEKVRAKKRAEARLLERERETARQREREVEAFRERKWLEERKTAQALEKKREKERQKDRTAAREMESNLKSELEKEKEANKALEAQRQEQRQAETLARKGREMEKEFEQRRIEELRVAIERLEKALEKETAKNETMRDEIEAAMEAKHGEQIQIERERLASEKEKFFLLNPTKDALESRLTEAEAAADTLKREVANLEISKERDQASHEYALHAQKCAYEKKLGEVQAKVDRLGATFRKLPPQMVFPPQDPYHRQSRASRPARGSGLDDLGMEDEDPLGFDLDREDGMDMDPDVQEGAYAQLLTDLKGLKSSIAGELASDGGVSPPSSESSTPQTSERRRGVGGGAASDTSEGEGEGGSDLTMSLAAAIGDRMGRRGRDREGPGLSRVAAALRKAQTQEEAEGGSGAEGFETTQEAELSSRVVDLVKAINEISPQVWHETAKAATKTSTDVLDDLLATERRSEAATAMRRTERSAQVIRKALDLARRDK